MNYTRANQNERNQLVTAMPKLLKSRLYLDNTIIYVAKNETGNIIGFLVGELGETECQILWLQVGEAYQRRGIATMLWWNLLQEVSSLEEIQTITAVMPEDAQKASALAALLLRLGFHWEAGQNVCQASLEQYARTEIAGKKIHYEQIHSLRQLLENQNLMASWKRTDHFDFAISDYALRHEFDPDCSYVSEKNGLITGYLFVRQLDEKIINVAYLAQHKSDVSAIVYLMNAAGYAALKKYGKDTVLVMNAMTDKTEALIRKLFPDGQWTREKLLRISIR